MRHLPGPAICHSCRRLPDRHLHGAQNSAGNLLAGRGVLPQRSGEDAVRMGPTVKPCLNCKNAGKPRRAGQPGSLAGYASDRRRSSRQL
jgi:hypothetical protein